MQFSVGVGDRDDYTVVTPRGEVDFATALALKQTLNEALARGRAHLVVDLEAVDFLESTGLGALIGARRRALGMGGSLSLVTTHQELLRIFRVTGMDTVFTIHDSVAAAVVSI